MGDVPEAVEAATKAISVSSKRRPSWLAKKAVECADPIIRADEREQIMARMEGLPLAAPASEYGEGYNRGIELALAAVKDAFTPEP